MSLRGFANPSQRNHDFSRVPRVEIPRSVFRRSHSYKTTISGSYLYPVYVDEALPGDTFSMRVSSVARFTTLIRPIMDNVYLDFFFFSVPNRLLWTNWKRFMGERDPDPDSSIDYSLPQVSTVAGGFTEGSLGDYFGLPIGLHPLSVSALPWRAYYRIWDSWFRDQNLHDSVSDPIADYTDDGPQDATEFSLLKRCKRHDYFTSCLPDLQKGDAVDLPLGVSAPVITSVTDRTWDTGGEEPMHLWISSTGGYMGTNDYALHLSANDGDVDRSTGSVSSAGAGFNPSNLYADLSGATAATINELREAFQLQRMFERDMRSGSRYTEIVRSHFGVTSPDARMQRPEYIGGGSQRISVEPVYAAGYVAAQHEVGDLFGVGVNAQSNIGFTKSFTEHCTLIGLVNLRTDLNYQRGINRMWSRQTRYDFYWPSLAFLGEQEVLNKEIWANADANDDLVFGYQERWAEYRFKPSEITSLMRSDAAAPLDSWHLAQDFVALPVLNSTFIEDDPPFDRVMQVTDEDVVKLDIFYDCKAARPMPMYSVPGLIDHF